MRQPLRYTLVTDGSSDAALRFPIDWLLRNLGEHEMAGEWADLRWRRARVESLPERIRAAAKSYPCDLLIVHRDAEGAGHADRLAEIATAIRAVRDCAPHVAVAPVRMTEAWLLHDERAIRIAAGNPNGTVPLRLPDLDELERHLDPKRILRDALLAATGARGRRLKRKKRDFPWLRYRVAELIEDYAPLRGLPAFHAFEGDLRRELRTLGTGSSSSEARGS